MVVEQHKHVGTRARLNRRRDARLQVVAVDRLQIDLDAERFLTLWDQFLAQQLIGCRNEIVPADPVYGRALCERGRAPGRQNPGHATGKRSAALENVTSSDSHMYSSRAVPGLMPLGRSYAGFDCVGRLRLHSGYADCQGPQQTGFAYCWWALESCGRTARAAPAHNMPNLPFSRTIAAA